jgi:hypothetical protein
MNINEFIYQHNLRVPSVEQIVRRFQNTPYKTSYSRAEENRKQMLIEIKDNEKELNNTVDDLIEKTNIGTVMFGSINFSMRIWIIEDVFKEFASYNDSNKICLNQETGEIVLIHIEQYGHEVIAVSFNQFLHFLHIYNIYDRSIIFGDGTLDASTSLELERLIDNGLDSGFVSGLIVFN